jgi:hypothetical protein
MTARLDRYFHPCRHSHSLGIVHNESPGVLLQISAGPLFVVTRIAPFLAFGPKRVIASTELRTRALSTNFRSQIGQPYYAALKRYSIHDNSNFLISCIAAKRQPMRRDMSPQYRW